MDDLQMLHEAFRKRRAGDPLTRAEEMLIATELDNGGPIGAAFDPKRIAPAPISKFSDVMRERSADEDLLNYTTNSINGYGSTPTGTRIGLGSKPPTQDEIYRGRAAILTQGIDGGRSYVSGRDTHFGEGGTYRDSNRTEIPWEKSNPVDLLMPPTKTYRGASMSLPSAYKLGQRERYLDPYDEAAALDALYAKNPNIDRKNLDDADGWKYGLRNAAVGMLGAKGDLTSVLGTAAGAGIEGYDKKMEQVHGDAVQKQIQALRQGEKITGARGTQQQRRNENVKMSNDDLDKFEQLDLLARGQDITIRGQDAAARSGDLDRAVNAERYSIANKLALEQYKLQAKQAATADPSLKPLLEEHAKYMNAKLQQGRETDVLSFPEWIALQQGAKLKAIAR